MSASEILNSEDENIRRCNFSDDHIETSLHLELETKRIFLTTIEFSNLVNSVKCNERLMVTFDFNDLFEVIDSVIAKVVKFSEEEEANSEEKRRILGIFINFDDSGRIRVLKDSYRVVKETSDTFYIKVGGESVRYQSEFAKDRLGDIEFVDYSSSKMIKRDDSSSQIPKISRCESYSCTFLVENDSDIATVIKDMIDVIQVNRVERKILEEQWENNLDEKIMLQAFGVHYL